MFFDKLFRKEAKENYVYKDKEGKELIYLGRAVLFDDEVHSTGFVTISDYEKNIYIERNVLESYPRDKSLKDILEDLMKEYKGMSFNVTGLIYSKEPLKAKEIGIYPKCLVKENANMGSFHITFDLTKHIYERFEKRAY